MLVSASCRTGISRAVNFLAYSMKINSMKINSMRINSIRINSKKSGGCAPRTPHFGTGSLLLSFELQTHAEKVRLGLKGQRSDFSMSF